MFCTKCGKEAVEGSQFCNNCGNPMSGSQPITTPPPPPPTPPLPEKKKSGCMKWFFGIIGCFALLALFISCSGGSTDTKPTLPPSAAVVKEKKLTTGEKKSEMEKALAVITVQNLRSEELAKFFGETFADFSNRKINASKAKEQMNLIHLKSLEAASNIRNVETPKWLSPEFKIKFDEMKNYFVESNELMGSAAKTIATCIEKGAISEYEQNKMTEDMKQSVQKIMKGVPLVSAFVDGAGIKE